MSNIFPLINHIDDVLPAIHGRRDFSVVNKNDYKVVKYNFIAKDTFPSYEHKDCAMRRECRGMIFNNDGKLLSRPFHKFFNYGERHETRLGTIGNTKEFIVTEKLDGSMVRPVNLYDHEYTWCTKGGFTDVGRIVQHWWFNESKTKTDEAHEWILKMLDLDFTPIFEFTSPNNRVVMKYAESGLTLLAVRNNHTGIYMPRCILEDAPFSTATILKKEITNAAIVDVRNNNTNMEGYVLQMPNGDMVKIKTQWYALRHSTLNYRSDHKLTLLAYNNKLDDVLPLFDYDEAMEIIDKTCFVLHGIDRMQNIVETEIKNGIKYIERFGRKQFALDFADKKHPCMQKFIYMAGMYPTESETIVAFRKRFTKFIHESCSNKAKFEVLTQWIKV